MDAELLKMLTPPQTPKVNYVANPPLEMSTQVFWEEPIWGPAVMQRDQMSRSVKVKVYCLLEAGE
jgi:hypothetical protein